MYFKKQLRTSIAIFCLMTVLLSNFVTPFASDKSDGESKKSPQEKTYLVGFKQDVDRDQFMSKKSSSSDNKKSNNKSKKFKKSNGAAMQLTEEEAQELRNDPEVLYVEEDSLVQIASIDLAPEPDAGVMSTENGAQSVPWGLSAIGADLSLENDNKGENIKIAVLDTGSLQHTDLMISGGVSFVGDLSSYHDDNGHGTHVIGTIAASDNAVGVVGVAPEADIYAVKVLDQNGGGYYSQIIEGIEWCIENNVRVINMSFGGTQYSRALHEAVIAAHQSGIIMVAAAGNNGPGPETETYPARFPEVISVGATEQTNQIAPYSSTGEEIDLVAPGTTILSTTSNGEYGVMSGTSMAAAHVTGSAAALWSHNMDFSSEQVKARLYQSATGLEGQDNTGYGLINLARALGLTGQPIPPGAAPLSATNSPQPTPVPDETIAPVAAASTTLAPTLVLTSPANEDSVKLNTPVKITATGTNCYEITLYVKKPGATEYTGVYTRYNNSFSYNYVPATVGIYSFYLIGKNTASPYTPGYQEVVTDVITVAASNYPTSGIMGFEGGSYTNTGFKGGWSGTEGIITSVSSKVISGTYSVNASSNGLTQWYEFLHTVPELFPLEAGATYKVTFKGKTITAPSSNGYMYFFARTQNGGQAQDVGHYTWTDAPANGYVKSFVITLKDYDDYYLTWGIRYGGEISIDDIEIVKLGGIEEKFERGTFASTGFTGGLDNQGRITSAVGDIISGTFSAKGVSTSSNEWFEFLNTDPNKMKLDAKGTYKITFKAKTISSPSSNGYMYFYARTQSGGESQSVGQSQWTDVPGSIYTKTFIITLNNYNDYSLVWGLHYGGQICVDDIEIVKLSGRAKILYAENFNGTNFPRGEYTTPELLSNFTNAGWEFGSTTGTRYGIESFGGGQGDKYLKIARISGYPSMSYTLPQPVRVNGAPLPYDSPIIDPGSPGKNAKLIFEYNMRISKSTESGHRYAFSSILPPKDIDPNKDVSTRYISHIGFERSAADQENPIIYKGNNVPVLDPWTNKNWYHYKIVINITDNEGNYISLVDVYVDGVKKKSDLPFAYICDENGNVEYPRDVALAQVFKISTYFSGSFGDNNAGLGIDNILVTLTSDGDVTSTTPPKPTMVPSLLEETFIDEDFESYMKYPNNGEYTEDNGLMQSLYDNGWAKNNAEGSYGILSRNNKRYLRVSKLGGEPPSIYYTFPKKIRINNSALPAGYTGEDPGHPGRNASLVVEYKTFIKKSAEDGHRYAWMNLMPPSGVSSAKTIQIGYEQNAAAEHNPFQFKGAGTHLDDIIEFDRFYDVKLVLKITDASGNYLSLSDVYIDGEKVIENQPISFTGNQSQVALLDKIGFTTNFSSSFYDQNPGMGIDCVKVRYHVGIKEIVNEDFDDETIYPDVNVADQEQLQAAGWVIGNAMNHYGVVRNDENNYLKISSINGNGYAGIQIPFSYDIRLNDAEAPSGGAAVYIGAPGKNAKLTLEFKMMIRTGREKYRTSSFVLMPKDEIYPGDSYLRSAAELRYAYVLPNGICPLQYMGGTGNVIDTLVRGEWYDIKMDIRITDNQEEYVSLVDIYVNSAKVLENQPLSFFGNSANISVINKFAVNTNIIGQGISDLANGIGVDDIKVTYSSSI